ncbi:MAG TPA: phosphoglycerate kinase [Syntrophomonadaceae bacterium]|nr:phosphoglycerate kinase [Syntrophomonadaceae bacterium]
MRTIRDADLTGKRVLMRVDFNVPMDDEGHITDDARIVAALPTIKYILDQGGQLILMSHLGRPKGKRNEKLSLRPVAKHLEKLLNEPVQMADDCIGPAVHEALDHLNSGQILMLENVRFYPEEEKNDPSFAESLAMLADIYVNDAFGTAHRAHASTAGVADFLPTYAGFLLEKEVQMLRQVLENPGSPKIAIMGGAKIKDKLGLVKNFLNKMDVLLLGGGMANTFLKASGIDIGKSLYEPELIDQAREILQMAAEQQKEIILPVDVVVTAEIADGAEGQIVNVHEVPEDQMIVDIGPETVAIFSQKIATAQTIIWNGPLGVYEQAAFARGTQEVAKAIAKAQAISVIGGGDSAAAIHDLGLEKEVTHISTGGGATLEFLEGIELPGVKVCES